MIPPGKRPMISAGGVLPPSGPTEHEILEVAHAIQPGTPLSDDAVTAIIVLRRARIRYECLEEMLFDGILDAELSDKDICGINDVVFIRTAKPGPQGDRTN